MSEDKLYTNEEQRIIDEEVEDISIDDIGASALTEAIKKEPEVT